MIIKYYEKFFENIQACALNTAVALFIFYLFSFIGIAYGFTVMPDDDTFIAMFERYLILAICICMLLLFGNSTVLIYAIMHSHRKCLILSTKIYLGGSSFFTIVTLAAGIYSIVEGTVYIGASVVAYILVLQILHLHTIFTMYATIETISPEEEDAEENS